jgi:predicted GH43/DUF377 family glycosyl hydrolase
VGIEDPRITFVDELGKYAVTYTAFSREGPGVALALTTDFDKDSAEQCLLRGDSWISITQILGWLDRHGTE